MVGVKMSLVWWCMVVPLAMAAASPAAEGRYAWRVELEAAGGGCRREGALDVRLAAEGALQLSVSDVFLSCGAAASGRRRAELGGIAYLARGGAPRLYLAPGGAGEGAARRNLLRGLASLLLLEGAPEGALETDAAGSCRVHYRHIDDNSHIKTKSDCIWRGEAPPEAVLVSRSIQYWFSDGQLQRAAAEDSLQAGALPGAGALPAVLAARGATLLERSAPAGAPAGAPAALPDIDTLLDSIQADGYLLDDIQLEDELTEEDAQWLEEDEEVVEIEDDGEDEEESLIQAAWGASVQRGPEGAAGASAHRAAGAARALGAGGAARGLRAARALLARHDAAPRLRAAYLAGLASAHQAHESVIEAVLNTNEWGPRGALAGAAAARGASRARKAALARRLALARRKAKDEEEIVSLTEALGALGGPEAVEELARIAEEGGAGALAAAGALVELREGGAAENQEIAGRMGRVALRPGGARPLEERHAALEAALALGGAAQYARLAGALGGAPPALRRLYWARLGALPDRGEVLRQIPMHLQSWDARAIDDKSEWLSVSTTWGGVSASVRASVCLVRGAIRAGRVTIAAGGAALALALRARGLDQLAGGPGGGAAEEGEGEGGALWAQLRLGGVGAPQDPLTLFESQAQLLGLVWSGAGSSWGRVWRGAGGRRRRGALALGGAPLRLRAAGGAAGALRARAAASLWARAAGAGALARAGGAWRLRARWGPLRLAARQAGAPALRLRAHLDFYDEPQLCLLLSTDHYHISTNTSVSYGQGWGPARLRRSRVRLEGRCLALGAPLARACARAPPPDEDD